MKIKKAIALMIGLVLIVSLALPGTLAVSADQSAASSSLTLAGGTVSSVPEEKEAPTTEGTEAPTTEGTEASTTEGTEASTEGTDQTTAPTETEPSAPTEVTEPSETTLPTEPETPSFDPQAVYDQLMACTTVEEMDAILDTLTEEQFAQFTEEMLEDIKAHYAELAPADTSDWIPAVNVTNVAPLLPPVSGRSPLRTFSAVAPYANDATGSDSEGMHRSKTATVNDDGTYTIRLEAYATGESVITTVEEEVPTDIVLVLDQSGSMADCINCGGEFDEGNVCSFRQAGTAGTLTPKAGTVYYYYDWFGEHYDTAYHCDGADGHTEGWYSSHGSAFGYDYSQKLMDNTQLYVGVRHQSRLSAIKTAATSFVNAVAAKAAGADGEISTTNDNVNHRIAVVGFASQSGHRNNTELLSIEGRNSEGVGVAYDRIITQNYKDVVQSMDTTSGQNMVKSAINALAASGATRVDLGMTMAKDILEKNPVPVGEKRNRVVIVFTDGSPTDDNGFQLTVANSAIITSTAIKEMGASVYSIGVFSGADANSAGTKPGQNLGNNSREMTAACNWFMQQVSSNNGTPKSPSYYLSASDSASLTNIFQQISNQIESGGTSSTLTSEAVVKDIISPQFTLPADATANNITLETYACTDKDASGNYTWSKNNDAMNAKATVDNDQVSVTGFDFSENYVGTVTEGDEVTYRGNKLVISFTVEPKAGFLGGNDVPTNTSAGVYKDGNAEKPILEFEQPTVNVPIDDVKVTAKEKNVYLLNGVTADQLKEDATVTVGKVPLDLSKDNYGLESWQTQYVNITVEVKDGDGNAIPTDGLTDDTTYNVTVTVEPTTNGLDKSSGTPAKKQYNSGEGNINVFKPELTFQDSTAYYGETVPNDFSNTNKVGAEKWKHNSIEAVPGDMLGTVPTLDLSYTPDASKLDNDTYTNQDVPVSVTVKIGKEDVTSHTTFEHKNCDSACGWTTPKEGGNPAFLIHVKSCTLTITKTGWETIDENQSFVFNVTDAAGNSVTRVVIAMVDMGSQTSNSVTIKGLKVGKYTVTEDTGWSWRYEPQGNDKSVTLSANNSSDTVTFTNDREKDKWLSGDAYAKNVFDYFKKSN